MAKNYSEILSLVNAGNQMGLSNTIKRDYGIPLDFTSVQESYNKAVEYAATSTLAYVGQTVAVGNTLYIITDTSSGKHTVGETEYDVFLTEVGSKTEGDGNTIVLDGKTLKLAGLTGLDNSKTYVPSLINGKLVWAEPDTATAEGQAQAIEALEVRASALEDTVNGTDTAKGLVEKVSENAQAIADEAAARGLAVEALEGMIEEIESSIAGITHFTTKVVESTDEVTEVGVLYLIKDASVEGVDKYNEYLYIEGQGPVLIGDTTTDLSDYVTNDALATAIANFVTTSSLATTLADYAKTADVEANLDKKIETASIAHTTEQLSEGATVEGTKLNIVVDAFTKAETRQYVAETISQMTGGESAADVLLALNNYKSDNDERVGAIETKNSEQDTAIAAAQAQADKGVQDAAKVAADLGTTNTQVATNKSDISALATQMTGINETLTGEISTLKAKNVTTDGEIAGLKASVESHATTLGTHTTEILALQGRDTEIEASIAANTAKFADYVTAVSYAEDKATIEKSIEDEAKARDDADKAFETRIGTLEGKFGTGEGTVEAQIAAAIQGVQSQLDALDSTYATDAELKTVKEALEAEAANHALKADVKSTTDAIAKSISDETAARTEAVSALNTAISEMGEAYKTADVAVLSEVQKQLGTKADKSAVDAMYTNDQIDTAVQGAKDYAKGLVDAIPAAPVYSLKKAADSGEYAAVYNLTKDGEIVGDTINIPKDIVVKSGSVVGDEIVLVLNDEDSTEIKIPVGSLIEYVTSGSATGDMVVINVSDDHKVTATITDGTVTLAKLTTEVQTAIGKAHTHENATVLESISADKVAEWDAKADLSYVGKLSDGHQDMTVLEYIDAAYVTRGDVDGLLGEISRIDSEISGINETIESNYNSLSETISHVDEYSSCMLEKVFGTEAFDEIVVPEGHDTLVDWIDSKADAATVNAAISGVESSVYDLTAKLAGIDTTVTDAISAAVNGIKATDIVKASEEVTVAEDGTLGLGTVNVSKLVQDEELTLILHGGSSVG